MKREKVERLINLWLNVFSNRSGDHLGWFGDNVIGRMMDGAMTFGGQSQDQSNVTSIRAIQGCRSRSQTWHLINDVVQDMRRECPGQIEAVLAKHYYCGACPKTSEGDTPDKLRAYTNADRAAAIGQSLRTFERNLSDGYAELMRRLDRVAGF